MVVGAADWLGYVAAIAFISVVFGEYLHRLGIAQAVPVGVLAPAATAALALVQLFGTRIAGGSQELGSALKAAAFAGLIGLLLFAPLSAQTPAAAPALTSSVTLLGLIVAGRGVLGAYQGWNVAAYFGEELEGAGQALARAIFAGIGLVTLVYVLVNVALLRVLSPHEMAGSTLVAADAVTRVLGPAADRIVTAISMISLVTILNVALMHVPRIFYAVARDAEIPVLSHVTPNGSPAAAIIATAAAAALFATVGVYSLLLTYDVWLQVAVAGAVNAAALTLRQREPSLERPWRMPLFPLPAIFSLLLHVALLAALLYENAVSATEASALAAVLGAGTWFATRRRLSE